MSGRIRAEEGLGLIELMITFAVMVTIVSIFGHTMISAQRVSNVQEEESRALDTLRTEMARIERDVRWAQEVLEPPPASATGTPPSIAGTRLQIVAANGVGVAVCRTYELRVDSVPTKAELFGHISTTNVCPSAAVLASDAHKLADDLVYSATPFQYYPAQAGDRNGYLDLTLRVQMRDSRDPREVTTRLTVRNVY